MLTAAEVTTKDAAEYLGVTIPRVLFLIRAGRLVADKKGTRDYWITAESLKEYKKSPRKVGRPVGTVSGEPAQNRRGTGEAAEREREYQREYKRRMRAGLLPKKKAAAKKAASTKRPAKKR